jgi:hypothetical protein
VLEKYERPLTADERAILNAQLESGSQPRREEVWRRLLLCLAILMLGIVALVGLAAWLDGKPHWVGALGTVLAILIVIVCVAAGCGAWIKIASYRADVFYATQFIQQTSPQIRAALENGRASVCRVTAVAVIVIEEYLEEDMGSGYLYDLGDGTSFYLRGHEYDLDEGAGFFVPRQFEIVRTAENDLWLGIFHVDGRLEPELQVSMKEMPQEYVWHDPQSESVLPGRPREVLSRLGYRGVEQDGHSLREQKSE